jgi:hypothetical protein
VVSVPARCSCFGGGLLRTRALAGRLRLQEGGSAAPGEGRGRGGAGGEGTHGSWRRSSVRIGQQRHGNRGCSARQDWPAGCAGRGTATCGASCAGARAAGSQGDGDGDAETSGGGGCVGQQGDAAAHRGGGAGPFFTRGMGCRRGGGDGVQGTCRDQGYARIYRARRSQRKEKN